MTALQHKFQRTLASVSKIYGPFVMVTGYPDTHLAGVGGGNGMKKMNYTGQPSIRQSLELLEKLFSVFRENRV